MSDQGELYEKSWILYHILDKFIGSQEIVDLRRKVGVLENQVQNPIEHSSYELFSTGSRAEGMKFRESDVDHMFIDQRIIVKCPNKDISMHIDTANKSVLMMREANSRPGYVNLELVHLEKIHSPLVRRSIVTGGGARFISSEMYRRKMTDNIAFLSGFNVKGHGPAANTKLKSGVNPLELDAVNSFRCYNWPNEANEWINRPRLHNWPDKALRDQIIQGGCHVVPVGDKTSADTFLQWRISFATAERKLIYSLSHVQFLVYGLLKIFLKQISGMLKQILDEEDVLSSYIIKTVIFHAVEATPDSFWKEQHTFLCFMFCLKTLINFVNAGCCPNYFIKKNNMFLGKVCGQNRQKLVRYLTDLYSMNWGCLSVGTVIQPTIGERIRSVMNGVLDLVLPAPAQSECGPDSELFDVIFALTSWHDRLLTLRSGSILEEFLSTFDMSSMISYTGMKVFGEHINARGNKEKYKSLRKCRNLLRPFSTICTSPGLLSLATYYYQTGNYMKTLEMCDHVISSPNIYLGNTAHRTDWDKYERICCGRGYSLQQKCQRCVSDVNLSETTLQFYPSQLHREIRMKLEIVQFFPSQVYQIVKNGSEMHTVHIPPLPYAVFLSFLCYHELGDTRRRDRALIRLQAVKYDEEQGVNHHWIVHNILEICYNMVGDNSSALIENRASLDRQRQNKNNWMDTLAHLFLPNSRR